VDNEDVLLGNSEYSIRIMGMKRLATGEGPRRLLEVIGIAAIS